jgi:tetratricopeptide (TPR) repeat protein
MSPAVLLLLLVSLGFSSFAQERTLTHEEPPLQPRARVALVIGNAAYAQVPLTNPPNDARAMAGTLTELGFTVDLAIDADRKKLGGSIDRFTSRLRRGDVAVFYYAGHGMQVENENYLIPTDFVLTNEADAKYDAYPVDRLLEGMERAGTQLNVIILDACRNNPYRGSRAMGGGLAAFGSGAGTFVALATSPGKTASDNSKGANGLFTTYLLDSLKQTGLGLDEVFNRTRRLVYTASNETQTPWSQTNVIGNFYFRPTTAAAPVSRPPTQQNGIGGLMGKRLPPSNVPDPTYQQAVRDARGGVPANAVEALSQVIRKNPNNTDAYYERAMTYFALGKFTLAFEDFSRILLSNRNDVNALIGRSAVYLSIADYQYAVADLDRVLAREPDNQVAFFNRGLAYAGLNQNQKAIDDYTRVIGSHPKWPSTWYNRGIVYAASGDFKRAIADYNEAARLRPDRAATYANRGVAFAVLQEFPRALADLDQAIRLQPGDAAMLNSRGMVLLEMKQPARALKDFDEAIRLNSILAVAYSNRAEARRALGDVAGADADLKRSKELGAH